MSSNSAFIGLEDGFGSVVHVRTSEIRTVERHSKGRSVLTLNSGRQLYFPRGARWLTRFILKLEAK